MERANGTDVYHDYPVIVDCAPSLPVSACLATPCNANVTANCSRSNNYTASPLIIPAGARIALTVAPFTSQNRGGPTSVTVETRLVAGDPQPLNPTPLNPRPHTLNPEP